MVLLPCRRMCYSSHMATPRGQSNPTLTALAASIRHSSWRVPSLFFLAATRPLAPLGRQLLLLSQPLLGVGCLSTYARLLSEPGAWEELAALVDQEPAP